MDKSSLICLFRLLSLAEPLAHNLPKLAFEHIKAIASSLAFSSEKFFVLYLTSELLHCIPGGLLFVGIVFVLGAVGSASRRCGVVMTLLHQDITSVMDASASVKRARGQSVSCCLLSLLIDHAVDCCLTCTATEPQPVSFTGEPTLP
jgi:hypothetical protein